MPAATIDFPQPLVRGDTLQSFYQEFTQEDKVTPLELASARMHLRDGSGTLVHSWISGAGITIVAGRCTMAPVAPALTKLWPVRPLFYDLEVVLASGETFTLTQGSLSMLADRTI